MGMRKEEKRYEKELREYKKERRKYTERLEHYENRQAELQDRWVITTSGAALAVTLTFVRELEKPLEFAWTLWASWGLLALSVLTALISIAVGRAASRSMITRLREEPDHPNPEEATGNLPKITEALNCIALGTFAGGLAAVVAFGAVNLG